MLTVYVATIDVTLLLP